MLKSELEKTLEIFYNMQMSVCRHLPPGPCCVAGSRSHIWERNELLAAPAALTSTSFLPLLVSAVGNERKASVAFPFSLGV